MQRPLLIGHRGARGLFPENTMEGFVAAAALGIDGIELDVAVTADGVPVVCHDPALSPDLVRTPDGAWLTAPGPLIRTLTMAQLAQYDVGRARPGGAVALAHPEQRPIDGARIPTLEAALAQIDTHFVIELKSLADHPDWTVAPEDMADRAAAVMDRLHAGARVMIESFDWRAPRHLRRTRPDLRLAWLTCAETVGAARLWWDGPTPADYSGSVPRAVAAEGGPVWAPDHVDLTQALIDEAHELGLTILAWTVNQPGDMARLIGWGVDGLITDRPDIGRHVMQRTGISLPDKPSAPGRRGT
jgi:glycerophosphoryl diester phosphodiesterase